MKSVYIIYDEIAEEIVTAFHASNDEHAVKLIKNILQKEPQDIKIKVYKVCNVEVFRNKEVCVSSDCGTSTCIFEYPFTTQKDEQELKDNIVMEE